MIVLSGDRGEGRTKTLVGFCESTPDSVLIVSNTAQARGLSERLGGRVYSVQDCVSGKLRGTSFTNVVIDDVDLILQNFLGLPQKPSLVSTT